MDELFPAPFLKELEALSVELRKLRGAYGEGRHRRSGLEGYREFRGHARYDQGEDPRHIDWNAYGRLGKLYLKRYALEREEMVTLLPDLSLSMDRGEPNKYRRALQICAAFAALALKDGIRVEVVLGESVGTFTETNELPRVLNFLRSAQVGDKSFLEDLPRRLGMVSRSSRNLLIISDLLEPTDNASRLSAQVGERRRTAVVALASPQDANPLEFARAGGAYRFVDAEDRSHVELELSADAVLLYRRYYQEHVEAWQQSFARQQIGFEFCLSDASLRELFVARNLGGVVRWGS